MQWRRRRDSNPWERLSDLGLLREMLRIAARFGTVGRSLSRFRDLWRSYEPPMAASMMSASPRRSASFGLTYRL